MFERKLASDGSIDIWCTMTSEGRETTTSKEDDAIGQMDKLHDSPFVRTFVLYTTEYETSPILYERKVEQLSTQVEMSKIWFQNVTRQMLQSQKEVLTAINSTNERLAQMENDVSYLSNSAKGKHNDVNKATLQFSGRMCVYMYVYACS